MSNETMTDALAIELMAQAMQFPNAHGQHKIALAHIAAHLRVEAAQCQKCRRGEWSGPACESCGHDGKAQGEQQAVAWRYRLHDHAEGPGPWNLTDFREHAAILRCNGREVEPLYTRPQPVAPASKPVAWWNGIGEDITERSPYGPSIRWGAGAEDSGHDIPLYDGPNPIHYAPAPVAGDAVAKLAQELAAEWRHDADNAHGLHAGYRKALREAAGQLETRMDYALAQDRASQAGAAGVPEGWRLVPVEPKQEQIEAARKHTLIAEAFVRGMWAAMLAAAPTPAAEGEVRNG